MHLARPAGSHNSTTARVDTLARSAGTLRPMQARRQVLGPDHANQSEKAKWQRTHLLNLGGSNARPLGKSANPFPMGHVYMTTKAPDVHLTAHA